MLAFQEAAAVPKETLLARVHTDELQGLSEESAAARLKQYGLNIIQANEVAWWHILLRQLKSPFIYLLFGASLLSFFLGEARDGMFILLFISVNTLLGFYQEYKSESTAKLLKSFVESQVKVLREGKRYFIPARLVVPGDIVEFAPGDIIQADTRLLSAKNFSVNESILTGESEAQSKEADIMEEVPHEVYNAVNIAFSGTTVVTGVAVGVVFATASNKVVSGIAKLTTESARVSSFEKGISAFSSFILKTIGVTLVLMVIANLVVKGTSADVPELLLFAVALAVSVIPEALPVVTTFSLSQGAGRLAKKKVVVKRLTSIEDLGSISVLCTDKTGTITQNKMTLTKSLSYKSADIHHWAALASDFLGKLSHPKDLDSFDEALLLKLSSGDKEKLDHALRVEQLPFDPERRRTTVLIESHGKRFVISRGAPENVMNLCVDIEGKKAIEEWIKKEGYAGNRIMAIAMKPISHAQSREPLTKLEKNLNLVGFLSFQDPLKPTTLEAVHKAKKLGIQIKILTGDRSEVAGAVGVQIGLIDQIEDVMEGEVFGQLSDEEKHAAVERYHIFARVTPTLKYEIIRILQKKHEVGFLGEGINDAPALKIANVGIVVQSASDISKEAADIILLNKSLLTIIEGVEEGRKVFANTVKYIKATLASNFGNFYAIAVSSLFISFLPMLPIQILLVNLLSDFPMISVATDTVDPEELASPRSYQIREVATTASVLGLVSTCFDFLTFALFFKLAPAVLQTNWFMESILTELVLIYSIRTRKPFFKAKRTSLTIMLLTGIAASATIILPFTAFGQATFSFVHPTFIHMVTIGSIVAAYFICTETAKIFLYRFASRVERKAPSLQIN